MVDLVSGKFGSSEGNRSNVPMEQSSRNDYVRARRSTASAASVRANFLLETCFDDHNIEIIFHRSFETDGGVSCARPSIP